MIAFSFTKRTKTKCKIQINFLEHELISWICSALPISIYFYFCPAKKNASYPYLHTILVVFFSPSSFSGNWTILQNFFRCLHRYTQYTVLFEKRIFTLHKHICLKQLTSVLNSIYKYISLRRSFPFYILQNSCKALHRKVHSFLDQKTEQVISKNELTTKLH